MNFFFRSISVFSLVMNWSLLCPPNLISTPVADTRGQQNISTSQRPEVVSSIHLLEAFIESEMSYKGLPGMSIGIVHGSELIWSRGFGFSDVDRKTSATAQTLYRMASVTKLFTAIAIMQLRDEGKLRLDDSVFKILKRFKIRSRAMDISEITIRQLLTHTSGLPREAAFPYWTDNNFPNREQVREGMSSQETAYDPETKWKYSNLGFVLAGEIIAEVSGEPYTTYVKKHILDPLGMTSTTFALSDEQRARLAVGYGRRMPDGRRQVMPYSETKGLTAAAGLSSNVIDLARFLEWQLSDGKVGSSQVLKESTLREMKRVHWLQPNWKRGWGLGFGIEHQGERTLIGHAGELLGYRTQIMFSQEESIGIVVLTNADDGNPRFYLDQAFNIVAPAIKKATSDNQSNKQIDPSWSSYVGKYRDAWGDSQVLIFNDELVLIDLSEPDLEESLVYLVPEGKNKFRTVSDNPSFGEDGEVVTFEFGPNGKVRRIKIGENYSDRIN